jgi:hypothetical protein
MSPQLKVSLAQQIEEVKLCLSDLDRKSYRERDSSTWRLRLERLRAALRSLNFILEHKDIFLQLVDERDKTLLREKNDNGPLPPPPQPPSEV